MLQPQTWQTRFTSAIELNFNRDFARSKTSKEDRHDYDYHLSLSLSGSLIGRDSLVQSPVAIFLAAYRQERDLQNFPVYTIASNLHDFPWTDLRRWQEFPKLCMYTQLSSCTILHGETRGDEKNFQNLDVHSFRASKLHDSRERSEKSSGSIKQFCEFWYWKKKRKKKNKLKLGWRVIEGDIQTVWTKIVASRGTKPRQV